MNSNNKECHHIRTMMHEALSGTLVGEGRTALDRHLAGCRACRADYAVLRAIVRAVEEAPPLQPSADFTLRVMDRLPTPVRIFGRVPLAVFCAIIGILGLLAGIRLWLSRSTITWTFQRIPDVVTETGSIFTSFKIAIIVVFKIVVAPLRASLGSVLQSLPAPLEPHRLEPVFSVLIAIGIAYVVLKMVDGFQPTEFDSAPDESYS